MLRPLEIRGKYERFRHALTWMGVEIQEWRAFASAAKGDVVQCENSSDISGQYFRFPQNNSMIIGAGEVSSFAKRSLISYTMKPFRVRFTEPIFLDHVLNWHVFKLTRILNSMDYIVDVVECTDADFLPERGYALFIEHGGNNFKRIATSPRTYAIKVCFFSGCYWEVHNQHELERVAAIRE